MPPSDRIVGQKQKWGKLVLCDENIKQEELNDRMSGWNEKRKRGWNRDEEKVLCWRCEVPSSVPEGSFVVQIHNNTDSEGLQTKYTIKQVEEGHDGLCSTGATCMAAVTNLCWLCVLEQRLQVGENTWKDTEGPSEGQHRTPARAGTGQRERRPLWRGSPLRCHPAEQTRLSLLACWGFG